MRGFGSAGRCSDAARLRAAALGDKMDYQMIRVEQDAGVETITLANSRYRNAISPLMIQELLHELSRLDVDPAVKVVVVTGEGDAFSSGGYVPDFTKSWERERSALADRVSKEVDTHGSIGLDDPSRSGALTPERLRERLSAQHWKNPPFTEALRRLQKPSIAAVNGIAAGAGLDLALGCDMRLAADTAVFNTMYRNRGIHALSGNVYLLLRLLGPAKTYELLYMGQPVSAAEAERIGLVNRVVPRAALLEEARAMARHIAEGPSVMLGLVKYVVTRTMDLTWESAMELASTAYYLTRQTVDHKEGVQAFVEKRPPRFQGR